MRSDNKCDGSDAVRVRRKRVQIRRNAVSRECRAWDEKEGVVAESRSESGSVYDLLKPLSAELIGGGTLRRNERNT